MSWERYSFEDIPSIDGTTARAEEEIARLSLGPEGARIIRTALGKVLQDLRGEDDAPDAPESQDGHTALALPDRVTVRNAGLASVDDWTAGEYPVRATFALGGTSRQAVVEIPLASARSLIGRVVGVPPERLGASDLLTPVEQGILSFFAERIASGLMERTPVLEPLFPLTLLDLTSESAPFAWGSEGAEGWYALSGTILLVGIAVPYRLLLPWALLRRVRQRYDASPEAQQRGQRRSIHSTRPLGGVRLALTGRIGRLSLRGSELAHVEVNDIVLLDEVAPEVGFDEGRLTGSLPLAFDGHEERAGSVLVQVERDDARLSVCVQQLLPGREIDRPSGERRTTMDSTDGGDRTAGAGGNDPGVTSPSSPEGRALAEEAPIHLRVEIGRVRMTLRELSQLAPGAILELQKEPAAPVSLMVEDRMVGRGELVRVEGELGVRILSLV